MSMKRIKWVIKERVSLSVWCVSVVCCTGIRYHSPYPMCIGDSHKESSGADEAGTSQP